MFSHNFWRSHSNAHLWWSPAVSFPIWRLHEPVLANTVQAALWTHTHGWFASPIMWVWLKSEDIHGLTRFGYFTIVFPGKNGCMKIGYPPIWWFMYQWFFPLKWRTYLGCTLLSEISWRKALQNSPRFPADPLICSRPQCISDVGQDVTWRWSSLKGQLQPTL